MKQISVYETVCKELYFCTSLHYFLPISQPLSTPEPHLITRAHLFRELDPILLPIPDPHPLLWDSPTLESHPLLFMSLTLAHSHPTAIRREGGARACHIALKMSPGKGTHFILHSIGHMVVTWPHPAARAFILGTGCILCHYNAIWRTVIRNTIFCTVP